MTAAASTSPAPAPPLPGRHLDQLDALRTLAVAAVVMSHYIPRELWLGVDVLGEAGATGVRLFFALSGFLITGVLLDTRGAIRLGSVTALAALGRFYARRALRIFPLYFLVVGVCWVLGVAGVRNALGAFLTFTYNLHLMRQGWWDAHIAHFWSLSVEQQFYLLWPCLILFLPRRGLWPAAALAIVGAEITRGYYVAHLDTGLGVYVSPLAAGDALGAGALLAMAMRNTRAAAWLERAASGPVVLGVLLFWMTSPWWYDALGSIAGPGTSPVRDSVELLGFVTLIFGASRGFRGVAGHVARWRPITYLGKISYGLYVFHPLMLPVASLLLAWIGLAETDDLQPPQASLALALTVGTASLSWHAFEKPLNNLKRHF